MKTIINLFYRSNIMENYDVFSDPEFKTDYICDQILYDDTHRMKIECAWCKADMGSKPCNEGQQNEVSHGMCGSCKTKMEKEIEEYERR
jgi:hypothetical protein